MENKTEEYYVLADGGSYYVKDYYASTSIKDARKIKSIEEMITTIAILKDRNWDYVLYKITADGRKRIPDAEWMEPLYKWKDANPEAYAKLYANTRMK